MEVLVAISITLIVVSLLWRSTVAFALAIIFQQLFREVGLLQMAGLGVAQTQTATLYFCGTAALIGGYLISEFLLRNSPQKPVVALKPFSDAATWGIVVTAGALGLYHLFATGLPILSSNIETDRFDFTSSGLFGIPGRMYLFGINIAWIIAAVNARAKDIPWRSYGPWKWATAALILSTVLSGFKGDLFSLVLTVFALYTIISGNRVTLGRVLKRYWWAGLAALSYFAVVATLYPTYSRTGMNIFEQIFMRLTVIPAQAIQYAMEGRYYFPDATPIVADFTYFAFRYTGNGIPRSYSFERSVSAAIIGVNPSSDDWTTPVTVGAFAEVYASFGFIAALATMFVSGAILSRGESGRVSTSAGLVGRALIGLFMFNWLVKGGFAYYLINLSAVSMMLVIVGTLATLVHMAAVRQSSEWRSGAISARGSVVAPGGMQRQRKGR